MVLTYEYDDYRNRKSDSNSDYEPKDDVHFGLRKARPKVRSNRSLEQKKKKIRVEEGVNADDRKYEEETTAYMRIFMDTDGPGIDS